MKHLINRCRNSNSFAWGITIVGIIVMIIVAVI